MKKSYAFILLCLILASCKKNNTVSPHAADIATVRPELTSSGSISGTISPLGAAKSITVSALVNGKSKIFNTFSKLDGTFLIDTVPVGNYSLIFSANENYTAPGNMNVSVAADKSTEVGIVKFSKKEIGYGSLTGTVSPAAAASQVQAFMGGLTFKLTPDPTSGKFTFENIPEGTYQLYFLTADRFTAPATSKVVVYKDIVSNAGTYKFGSYGYSSIFTFKAGDTFREMPAKVTLIDGKLNILANIATGNKNSTGPYEAQSLTIKLSNVIKPGTYVFEGSEDELTYTSGRYYGQDRPMGSGFRYSSRYPGGKAEVTIAEIDGLNGIISGTFTATVVGIGKLPITNGVFKATYR